MAEVGLQLAWARYRNPASSANDNAIDTRLFVEVPNDGTKPDGSASLADLDEDTRAVVVHDGPFGIIIDLRTLKEARNGLYIQLTWEKRQAKRWVITLGTPGMVTTEELLGSSFAEVELSSSPDGPEGGSKGQSGPT